MPAFCGNPAAETAGLVGAHDAGALASALAAVPSCDRAEVLARYKAEEGHSVDATVDGFGDAGGAARAALTGGLTTGLGAGVDSLASKSPTLVRNVDELEADRWSIGAGAPGKGSMTDRPQHRVNIDPSELVSPILTTQTLAHESGHARYTPDAYVPPDGLTRDQYVARNVASGLRDEGEATITNIEVEREIMASGGPDIGVAGAGADTYKRVYSSDPDPKKDRDSLRTAIGNAYATGERPSTDPSKTYGQYYGKAYEDYWDQQHGAHPDASAPSPYAGMFD